MNKNKPLKYLDVATSYSKMSELGLSTEEDVTCLYCGYCVGYHAYDTINFNCDSGGDTLRCLSCSKFISIHVCRILCVVPPDLDHMEYIFEKDSEEVLEFLEYYSDSEVKFRQNKS